MRNFIKVFGYIDRNLLYRIQLLVFLHKLIIYKKHGF